MKSGKLSGTALPATVKTKICGMTRQADLDAAAELGVDICGFIFHRKSPRNVSPRLVASLESHGMLRAGVFVEQDAGEILEIMRAARLDLAQLHGGQPAEYAMKIGRQYIIRVMWPENYPSARDLSRAALSYADTSEFFLFDSGKSGGGSGSQLFWPMLSGLVLPRPWFLAGGLKPENLCAALRQCSPYGVDMNSGVEDAPGIKNPLKMKIALNALKDGM